MQIPIHNILAIVATMFLATCNGKNTVENPSNVTVPFISTAHSNLTLTHIAASGAHNMVANTSAALAPEIQAKIDALPAPYNAMDYKKGRRLARQCQTCHAFISEGGNRIGPHLGNIFTRQSAAVENFSYSKALSGANLIWTPEILDEWLANPRKFLPGNRMNFAGYRKPNDRRDIIGYLMIETQETP